MSDEASKRHRGYAQAVEQALARALAALEPTHWGEDFVPLNEIEAFMGRKVKPTEEADIRIHLRDLLDREGHD